MLSETWVVSVSVFFKCVLTQNFRVLSVCCKCVLGVPRVCFGCSLSVFFKRFLTQNFRVLSECSLVAPQCVLGFPRVFSQCVLSVFWVFPECYPLVALIML